MNSDDRWLDCLAADAEERELLLAGVADRPRRGAVDRGWDAFCTTVGVASVAGATLAGAAAPSPIAAAASTSASASAATVAAGGASQGTLAAAATAAAGKATLGLAALPVAAKATILGFTIGMGTLGTAHVVQRVSHDQGAQTRAAPTSRAPLAKPVIIRSSPNAPSQAEIPPTPSAQVESTAVAEDQPTVIAVQPAQGMKRPPNQTVDEGPTLRERSLAMQAEELAQIKRLLDSGASNEALARLEASVATHALSALAEDRDALYIEALKRTSNMAEARRRAESFCARYPNSPHRDRLRSLLESE